MKADRRTNPLQATLTAAALTAALVGTGHDARAEDAPPAEAKTWSWDGIYKADLLHIRDARGGVGLLNLRANADAGALFGWDDTTPAANCCGPTAANRTAASVPRRASATWKSTRPRRASMPPGSSMSSSRPRRACCSACMT